MDRLNNSYSQWVLFKSSIPPYTTADRMASIGFMDDPMDRYNGPVSIKTNFPHRTVPTVKLFKEQTQMNRIMSPFRTPRKEYISRRPV